MKRSRPHTTVILAMSADGKIADYQRSPARFSSQADQYHLQTQIAAADAVLFGAKTLRAYGTTLTVSDSSLQQQRQAQNLPAQPVQIVCSASGDLDPNYRFFRQPVPRWLVTTSTGKQQWSEDTLEGFERILVSDSSLNWPGILQQLKILGINKLAVLGGATLVGSLVELHLIDELWLTVCPLILGGETAPTPVGGKGLLETVAPRLTLLQVKQEGDELFLHYRFS